MNNKKLRKIYLCHEFDGIYSNARDIVEHIDKLVSYNSDAIYISPILLFGNLYDKLRIDLITKYKLDILNGCDAMIIFGNKSQTEDCNIEKSYCNQHNIKIIEFTDYCKQYLELIKNGQ